MEQKIDPTLFTIVRLDFRNAHTFTKNLNKPFDVDFCQAMDDVTAQLMREFCAATGFTQSDEISLLFLPSQHGFLFGGRVQKIVSVLASRCAVIFSNEFKKSNGIVSFDARIIQVDSHDKVKKYFVARFFDGYNNSILSFAQSLFQHKEIQKIGTRELEFLMQKDNGFDWRIDADDRFKFGSVFKFITSINVGTNRQTGQNCLYERRSVKTEHRFLGMSMSSFWFTQK